MLACGTGEAAGGRLFFLYQDMSCASAIIKLTWLAHGFWDGIPALFSEQIEELADDKSNLSPLRLLSFFAVALTVVHFMRRDSAILRNPVCKLIILCGQHSLQVFCLGILLSVIGQIVLTSWRGDVPMQLAVDLAGIALMSALAGLLTWYKSSSAAHSEASVAASGNPARRSMADNRAPRLGAAPRTEPIEARPRGGQLPLPVFP